MTATWLAVEDEGDARRGRASRRRGRCRSGDRVPGRAGDQLKEEPQPQVRVALGLVMWNPAPCSPSL